jgi:hypothetical protein
VNIHLGDESTSKELELLIIGAYPGFHIFLTGIILDSVFRGWLSSFLGRLPHWLVFQLLTGFHFISFRLASTLAWLPFISSFEPSLAFIYYREAWIFATAVSSVVKSAMIIYRVYHNPAKRSIQFNPIIPLLTPVVACINDYRWSLDS